MLKGRDWTKFPIGGSPYGGLPPSTGLTSILDLWFSLIWLGSWCMAKSQLWRFLWSRSSGVISGKKFTNLLFWTTARRSTSRSRSWKSAMSRKKRCILEKVTKWIRVAPILFFSLISNFRLVLLRFCTTKTTNLISIKLTSSGLISNWDGAITILIILRGTPERSLMNTQQIRFLCTPLPQEWS